MKHQKGFTLIEVIVVVGAIMIIMPALFGIIFSLFRQQIKIYRLSEVKRQGDYALSIIENTIRSSAISIYDQQTGGVQLCANAGATDVTVPYFRDEKDNWFRYVISSNRIASQSEVPNATANLTSSNLRITNLTVRCSRTASYSSPVVDLRFTISSGLTSTEERASMTYKTRIKLRNY